MTATASPAALASGPLTVSVSVDGRPIDLGIALLSVETWNGMNDIPRARLTFRDGNLAEESFPVASGGTFDPGRKISVRARYGGSADWPVFEGLVSKLGVEVDADGSSRLVVDTCDEAIRMTLEPRDETHRKIGESELMAKLVTRNGLDCDIPRIAGEVKQVEISQSNLSDWQFLLARTGARGMVVIVEGGKVTVAMPDPGTSPVLRVTFGEDVLDLRMEIDATDRLTAGPVEGAGAARGRVSFPGSGLAAPGRALELAGLGRRFEGTAFIRGVEHSIREGGWTTTVDLGLPPKW